MFAVVLAALVVALPQARWKCESYCLHEAAEPPARSFTPPIAWAGRVVTRPDLHIGVRAHAYVTGDEVAGALTIQITTIALP